MKRLSFILTLFACFATIAVAQTEKPVVAVENFANNGNMPDAFVRQVRAKVMESLTNTGRIEVADVAAQNAVNSEKERRKRGLNMSDERNVTDVGALNANYILSGAVNSYACTRRQEKNYKGEIVQYYTVDFSYTLKLIDPATSVSKSNNTYTVNGRGDTDDLAMISALNNAGGNFKDFIEANFALSGTIVQVYKANKDNTKAEKVYIDLGTSNGIQKGQKIDVYAVIDVAGEKANKIIGELKAEEVTSATRTLCKVTKGGQEINQAMSSGQQISLKTKATHSIFEKIGL